MQRASAILLVATAVGAVLRLAWIGAQPLWFDEQQQMRAAALPLPEMLNTIRGHAAAAPLDYFGTRLFLVLFGPTEAVRIWPALIGTLTVPLTYFAGRRWFGQRVGLVACVLLALAPLHIYYSGEARFYALSTFVAVLSVLTFGSRYFAASVGLVLYTHYFAFLVPAGLVLVYRKGWRELAIGLAAWLPWAIYALPTQLSQSQPEHGLSTVPTPTLLAELLVPDFNVSGLPLVVLVAIVAIATTLAAVGGLHRWWPLALVASAVLLTGMATWATEYFWSPRQILFTLPLFFLSMALGWDRVPRRVGVGLLLAWGVLMIPVIDGVTGSDAWQPRTPTLEGGRR